MKIVISGYYEGNSHINDAMLSSIITDMKSVCARAGIVVLSGAPQETKKKFNINTIHKYNILGVIFALLRCDLLVLGGGTLIQDVTSTKSLLYYLGIIRAAKFFKKKVMLYANGFNSLTSFKNSEKTRDVLNEVDVITLRDESSFKELENIGVTEPKIRVTADPAFLLIPDEKGCEILSHYGIPEDKQLLCVSVRKTKALPHDFEVKMAQFCDYAIEKYGLFPVFMPLDKRSDYSLCASIKNKMRNRSVVVGTNYSVTSILSIMKQMHICVGMSIYSLICSAICNVPMVGIYEAKESGLWEYMHSDEFIAEIQNLDEKSLKEQLDKIFTDYESIKSNLKFNVRILRGKARENRELMEKLLYGNK